MAPHRHRLETTCWIGIVLCLAVHWPAAGQAPSALRTMAIVPPSGVTSRAPNRPAPATTSARRFVRLSAVAAPQSLGTVRSRLAADLTPTSPTLMSARAIFERPFTGRLQPTGFVRGRLGSLAGRRTLEHLEPRLKKQSKRYCFGLRFEI